ncbi:NlpC/P60 family protein [Streptomyces sp. CRN 30]|uniref:C40 family peptidase n=1 Tax=Streptomyces sp. CRN 30 TaxID=3075613 RepID=UPI002A7FE769|nr:NlpC/P60 family protein [Streptomyces sp. CRN 30]
MSEKLLRLVCTAAVATGIALAPGNATAGTGTPEAGAGPQAAAPSLAGLLTDLQRLYREAEKATETYNGTAEKLRTQRADVERLDAELSRARLSLHDSRGAAGRLARQQYQSSSGLSPYLRLLLARDPQHALEQRQVIGRLARDRVATVGRLEGDEKRAGKLAGRAREALERRLDLAEQQKEQRDTVRERLRDVEEMIASLGPERMAALTALEEDRAAEAQDRFLASGALGDSGGSNGSDSSTDRGDSGGSADRGDGGDRTEEGRGDDGRPSAAGDRALRFAVEQLGKPYRWGAEGPDSFDCSGLTSVAWERAGTPIPRTSQEQWARLERVPLDRLRPGDLVVYFPEATHVAMYLGDGKVVQAPRPGARVKVSPIAANPVLGAVRPDPGGEPVAHYAPPRLPDGAAGGSDEGYAETQAPAAPETSIR